ncbi:MAG: two-component regulator propeller domain-containing protein [Bacteroidota bacterium]|nr:two-component regulator propeller domain-containing protein [Bacteroidota bacterium]
MTRIFLNCSVFIVLSFFLYAQQYSLIKKDKNTPRENILQTEQQQPLRTALQITHASKSGEWVKFANWNEATAVVAENDSIVWVGTSAGLIRWNIIKKTFKTFDATNGLNFPSITSLALDSKHQLWIGTNNGLVKYADGIFTIYDKSYSPNFKAGITSLIVDSEDRIYACTNEYSDWYSYTNGGFVVFDGATWKSVTMPDVSGGTGSIRGMICYNDTIYVSCGMFPTYIYTSNKGLENAPSWSLHESVNSFAIDYQDSLWALSYGRKILKYSNSKWVTMVEGVEAQQIWNDPRGGLWLSNKDLWYDSYILPYRLDFGQMKQGKTCFLSWLPPGICSIPGLSYQFNSQFALNSTNQFFATRWGLLKFDGSTWESILAPKTLLSNVIYSLGTSPTGEVYISAEMSSQKTNGESWNVFGGGGWINPQVKFKPDGSYWNNGIDGTYATGLDFDGFNALWTAYGSIKTQNLSGITEWFPKDIGMNRLPPYSNPQFMDIAVDRNENIWATGWYNGSVMYDRTNWHPYYSNDTILPNGSYDRIFADSKNRIWFGTNNQIPNYGFTIFENGRWMNFYSPDNFFFSFVFQIAEDHFGNIWLATWGGLVKYDGASFSVYDNTNSGLESNFVYAVTVDLRNNIWAGTRSGLYVYNSAGVQLGNYSYTSPVDSFSITSNKLFASARFISKPISSSSARFELQRSRSTNKFWTVAATEFSRTCCFPIELQDTSTIIGKYYYRIKRIENNGNTSYSSTVSFSGGKAEAHLLNSEWYFSGRHVTFRWKPDIEKYIKAFEILRIDTMSAKPIFIASLPSNSPKDVYGYYILKSDLLAYSSEATQYLLQAVFLDSTRITLQTFNVTAKFPSDFSISNNFPNPFNGFTTLELYLPNPDNITIQVYDLLGREILKPIIKEFDQGFQRVQLDFREMASGNYIYKVNSSGKFLTGKLLLLK